MAYIYSLFIGAFILGTAIIYFTNLNSSRNSFLDNYKEYIERYGHKLEVNEVTTPDGYILSLWHLVSNFTVSPEKVILLQVGFARTGLIYFYIEQNSLPYYLQEKGYDVWIGNNRGSKFSRKHVSKDSKNSNGDYWDYSMDEIAKYDVTSEIDYIKNRTGVKKLDFVGYSEGNTLFLMLYMDNPDFVENSINKFVSFGTIPNLLNTSVIVSDIIEKLYYFYKIIEPFNKVADGGGLIINDAFFKYFMENYKYFEKKLLDFNVMTNRTDAEGIKLLFLNYPMTISIYHLFQWEAIEEEGKLVYYNTNSKLSDELREYDYNVIKNWKIRSFITRSTCDGLSSYSAVTNFLNTIQNQSLITVFDTNSFAHLDYALAKSAYKDLYIPLVNFLEEK